MTNRVFLARQPIHDANVELFGYELLYRTGPVSHADIGDADQATAEVVVSTIMDIGLEQLVGEYRAFINVTPAFVLDALPIALPPEQIGLEVRTEHALADDLLFKLQEKSAAGSLIVLDNCDEVPGIEPLLAVADVVKLNVDVMDEDALRARLTPLADFNAKLLAKNVETPEQFDTCKELGFDYFQGYFFCRPQLIAGQRPGGNRLILLSLLANLQRETITADELESLIAQDPTLAYRLLRYLNSASFALRGEVRSIRHAINLLGNEALRKWTSLVLMTRLADDRPRELLATAMIRAKMCELIGAMDEKASPDAYFTVGLFSILDGLLDMPLPEALESLPLEQATKAAIAEQTGPMGATLQYVLGFEKGAWWEPGTAGNGDELSHEDAYIEAIRWADDSSRVVYQ
jgi:EAL and modified HD-GYP domain-containing signal transduction protein